MPKSNPSPGKRPKLPQRIELIDRNITRNRRFKADRMYAITQEVHVKKHVKLTIEDGTTILIQNGPKSDSRLLRAALIFNKGSRLKAQCFCVSACDHALQPVKKSDNGGLWFLGNTQNAEKDTIRTKSARTAPSSSFQATSIKTYYLGRQDPLRHTLPNHDAEDDIDGLSILGVGPKEWAVSELASYYSGDDGIDITNSHLQLDRIKVQSPCEDGLNLSSSYLEVRHTLSLHVNKSLRKDRDLVDFETDDGASLLVIHAGCQVKMNGVFGDEVNLVSKEMPKPVTRANNEKKYQFTGKLQRAALIYSLDAD